MVILEVLKIKYNKILVYFSLLLIFILSLSFVSANEDNSAMSDDLISNSFDNAYGINQNEIYVNTTNMGYANGSYDAPYSSLKEAIEQSEDNSTIILMDGRYSGVLNTGLTINKNLTIQSLSRNVTIDGENKYGFFNILSSNSLTINNINFINGYCDVNSRYNALIVNNGDLTLNNISFSKMNTFMSVIFNYNNLKIDNSHFNNILSSALAQIIINLGNARISNSNLPFRSVERGISTTVYNYDSIQIINSTVGELMSNDDYDSKGPAFNVSIENSKIHHMEQLNGVLKASNVNFTNGLKIHDSDVNFNRVIVFDPDRFSNPFFIYNSTLIAKSSIFYRGINSFSSKINVTYSVILDEITGNGGVSEVYAPFNWWGSNTGPKIKYAITSADYWIVMTFENKNSPIPVGTTDPFTVSLNKYTNGRTIYNLDNVDLLPSREAEFEAQNGKFQNSSVILSEGFFDNYLFNNTESSLVYAIIDSQRLRLVIGTGLTDYEWYVSPTKGNNGYGDGSYESPYQTLEFTIGKALNGNTIYLLNGTYSYGFNSNLEINRNLTIIGLESALMSRDNGRNIFKIQPWGSLLIKNVTFTVMSADFENALFIVNKGKLAIENSTFTNIGASAIIDGSGEVKISNSSFYKNKGAIITGNPKCYIDDIIVESTSRFYTNQMYKNYNYLFPIDGSIEIYNSIFRKNTVGIIYLHPILLLSASLDDILLFQSYAYVENSSFIDNTFKFNPQNFYSDTYGFYIYESHGSFGGFINNSTFINNYGPIGNVNFINSSVFIGNELAAINALEVNNSYFEKNSNILKEGSAYKGDGLVNANTVINTTFISNRAAYGGALYNPKVVHYSVFVNNTAAYEGNDIFSYSGDVDYSSNWWGENQKPNSKKVYIFLGNLKLDDWIIMSLVNLTEDSVKVSLNSLIDLNEKVSELNYTINQRPVFLSCVNGIIQPLNSTLKNNILYANVTGDGSSRDINVFARIDNQLLDLTLHNTSTKIVMENKVFYGGNNKYGFNLINVNSYKLSNQTLAVEIIKPNKEIETFDIISDENGYCEFNFYYPVGLYTVNVRYDGNGYFEPSNNSASINVLPSQTYLITHNKTYYGKNNDFDAVLTDVNGFGIINRTLHFRIIDSKGDVRSIDGVTNEFGRSDLILNLDVGQYTIETSFDGDSWYLSSKSKSEITILPVNSTIDVPSVVLYGIGNVYNITLKDEHGTRILGENIHVVITQGNLTDIFDLKTNDYGIAQLTINYLPGIYNIKATYAGDDIYGPAEASGVITVEKVISMISGFHHVSIPINGVYEAVLTDMYGRFIPNQTITLNLYQGKLIRTLTQVTDGNGLATFVINENEGSYLATLDYAGNIWYEDSTAAATIIVNNNTVIEKVSMNASDLVQYYGENKFFVIYFNDPNAFSQYGKTITATISSSKGVETYKLYTDAFGQARLQIKLDPGLYNITYTYTNRYYGIFAENSNKIIVYEMPTSIYASDVIMKVGDVKHLEIHLKDANNNPLKNMLINIDINCTKFNSTTNNDGIARLLITNGVGSYLASFSMTNTNYISSKSTARILVVDSDKTLTSIDSQDKTLFDNESVEFNVLLKDMLDNPISGANILINISTVNGNPLSVYQMNTNNLGEAIFRFKLPYGDYLVKSSYSGSQKYLESFNINYIKVLASENLTKTVLKGYFEENCTYKIVLIDENANLLSDKQIIFKINNNSYSKLTDENGEAFIFLGYAPGVYNIQTTFAGDDSYERSEIADSTVISGNATYLFVFDLVKYYKNGTQFYAQLLNSVGLPLSDKEIIISINNTNYTNKTDNEGWVFLKIDLNPGFYNAVTYYLPENVSESAVRTSTITVLPTVIGHDLVKYYRDSNQFKAQLLKGDGSPIVNTNVSMNLSGVFYKVCSDENGFAVLNINSEPGTYNLTVQNPYDGLLMSFKITVLPYSQLRNSHFEGSLINGTYVLSLLDDSDDGISDVDVFVRVNDKNYTVRTDDCGCVFIKLGSGTGIYEIESEFYGNPAFKESSFNDTVIISGNLTHLFANDVVKYYRNGTQFNALLVDALGNPLSGKKINITINGCEYSRVTDSNGLITFAINLDPGVYTISCAYYGESSLEDSFVVSKITVLSVTYGEDLVKYYRNASQFYVKVIDGTGSPIVGKNVTMNINGVFYNRLTNSDGIAKLNINLEPGKYILTAYNPYGNFAESFTITVLPTIMGEDIVKYYKNDTQYYVQLLDDTGNPLTDADVTMNINGVFYTRKTNDLGLAKLNINLNPGEYILTAYHPNGLACSNKITVLPILKADDLVMKYKDGSRFKALLLDGMGLPSANKSVTFNINGVFYNRITDANGFAYLNINLMPGKYIISSSYGDCTISNTIIIN